MKKKINIYVVGLIVALAGFIFSYDSSNMAGARKYLESYFNMDYKDIGYVIIAVVLGSMLGSLFAGYLGDKYGRKKSLIYGAILMMLGGIITVISFNLFLFYVGRIIMGFSLGVIFLVGPMYMVEVSPAEIRGRTGALRQILLSGGLILGYTMGYIFEKNFTFQWNSTVGWRYLYLFEILLTVVMGLAFFKIPESPRWLMLKGREEKAREVLCGIFADENRINKVMSEMKANIEISNPQKKVKIKGGLIYVLLICGIFPIFRQFSGVNAVTYYAQKIFATISNDTGNMAYFQSIFIGFGELAGAFFAVLFADKFGRKKLLMAGALGMGFSLGGISLFLYSQDKNILEGCLIYIYNFFFTISTGTLLTIYISEITPTIIRSKGMALSSVVNWFFDILVIIYFPILSTNGYLDKKFHEAFPFFIFTIAMGIFFIGVHLLPEAKGKTLEEIETYWRKKGDWDK
ncbi:MFS transporter, SP family, xylose:H+ symportor [Cetobacterium ceti]|uniref:MFS transporter, SP family, xylose:H+ symportor n=1 Tax=Cetobacterium ceti TaxID=180163 RepID=A0A1T4MYI0_9FUSO|nr:sugar porter family MFS transporter [Cetobacterium ceti]SJZ71827.1 MFS transporter, SP family, xylose:H+ symportor [Cetobacterium ceti]